jgi:hypothetical protein
MKKAKPIDVPQALRNVVQMLQTDPKRYKYFGVWWWPVKALLKRAGYGPDQLYMLGSYQDANTAAMVPREGLEDTLRAAFTEYGHNARYGRSGGVVENPDGELVTIFDEDAGL